MSHKFLSIFKHNCTTMLFDQILALNGNGDFNCRYYYQKAFLVEKINHNQNIKI